MNVACLLAIILWAGLHSILIFGWLDYFQLLRIDKETEYRGCDIIKHGEAAYPVSAWKENQYDVTASKKYLPSFMAHNTMRKDSILVDVETPGSESITNDGVDNVAMQMLK